MTIAQKKNANPFWIGVLNVQRFIVSRNYALSRCRIDAMKQSCQDNCVTGAQYVLGAHARWGGQTLVRALQFRGSTTLEFAEEMLGIAATITDARIAVPNNRNPHDLIFI